MNIKAKKTLGQNFMNNKKVIQKIVKSGEASSKDIILEIGPGTGALTSEILKLDNKVIAVEKDARLISFLEDKFSNEIKSGKFTLFEGDALELDYAKLGLENQNFIIIANLPYYITGKFLSLTLSHSIQPRNIVLLLQKEIVERITGEEWKNKRKKQTHKENILSISVKVYGEARYITTVSKKNFSPEPKIDSAVIGIYNINKEFFLKNSIKEREFFDFIKLVFGNKRKTLLKNMSKNYSRDFGDGILKKLDLDPKVRAEDLSLTELKQIFLNIKKTA